MFISIEAMDGAGKSTQSRRLAEALRAAGHAVTQTREPGGSRGAEDIRALLVSGEPDRWSAMTEILLFTAARRDHLERTIRPALARGEIVLSDRFADSTRIYQSARDPEIRATVDLLHQVAIGVEPDLTLILDLDVETSWRRSRMRNDDAMLQGLDEDRMEKMGIEHQRRLREGFLGLAAAHPERCALIDASGTPDEVFAQVIAVVEERMLALNAAKANFEPR